MEVLKKESIKYHFVPDTVFGEFYHIDKYIDLGCKTIEMETANLFKCGGILNFDVTAIFAISDNIVNKKSLYSGRSKLEKMEKIKTKHKKNPQVVEKLIEYFNS